MDHMVNAETMFIKYAEHASKVKCLDEKTFYKTATYFSMKYADNFFLYTFLNKIIYWEENSKIFKVLKHI